MHTLSKENIGAYIDAPGKSRQSKSKPPKKAGSQALPLPTIESFFCIVFSLKSNRFRLITLVSMQEQDAAVSRFRPICMTTITTILGVMPLIISHDPVFYSLALIIATGLLFGTLLTLGVVPVLYALLFRIAAR